MAHALRVTIAPTDRGKKNQGKGKKDQDKKDQGSQQTPAVAGGTVALARFGAGKSPIEPEVPKKAKLVFHTAFVEKARESQDAQFEPLASLEGDIELLESTGPVHFTIAPESELEYLTEVPGPASEKDSGHDDPEPRRITLDFDRSSFPSSKKPLKLTLPEFPDEAHYLELGAVLEIEGKEEGSVELNDRLDIPLSHLSYFKVRLNDEEGEPFADYPYELTVRDGSVRKGRTDVDGRVVENPVPRGSCKLRLLLDEEESPGASGESSGSNDGRF